MAQIERPSCSSSSLPPPPDSVQEKPVIVRVKRKLSQARFDGFWLEINERPSKRTLLDFETLAISGSTPQKVVEEPKSKKLFVQHVDTISNSDALGTVLHSFLTNYNVSKDMKIEERKRAFKLAKKPDKNQVAKQKHEEMARNARFEQIWKSRKDSLKEVCMLYDVLQVDTIDETPPKIEKKRDTTAEDEAILCNYLPLVREYIPSAATEIESDIFSEVSSEENYVYDLYTVEKDGDTKMDDIQADFPLVQVDNGDDDDFCDGSKSDYDTEDSNAEDNPLFDYPDEGPSEDEEERDPYDYCENSSDMYDTEIADIGSDDEGEEEHWRMGHC
ncbi:RNA-directed DNA methylation 4 isoform X2 [Carex littledalei]|uniref:RNA-directed DNA methylation 4 isoform X2 n=1 Tax=Carex littledalei TaxID=544730 RepID=A0A833QZT8_9POAL|nr:RNA-directed DNA methylation 4 isoform X2 [Carex littledalei]